MDDEKNIPVSKAAKLMGKGEQFIRIGLQLGTLPFGSAVKKGRWNYHISPHLFYQYIGQINEREKDRKSD